MIAILFPRFAPTCKMHHNRMLFPSLHFLEFRGVQPDPLIISRIPQILKIISVWEVFHRSVQHHVQSILIRKKALLRMLPDELHQPTCHIMLPPIVHIDQQYPRVKIRRTIHSNPVLQSNVISLLILPPPRTHSLQCPSSKVPATNRLPEYRNPYKASSPRPETNPAKGNGSIWTL